MPTAHAFSLPLLTKRSAAVLALAGAAALGSACAQDKGSASCQPLRGDELRCALILRDGATQTGSVQVASTFAPTSSLGGSAQLEAWISRCGATGKRIYSQRVNQTGRVIELGTEGIAQSQAGICVELYVQDCRNAQGSRTACSAQFAGTLTARVK